MAEQQPAFTFVSEAGGRGFVSTGGRGPAGSTGSTGAPGTLAGSAFGFGLSKPGTVAAATIVVYSYCPLGFTVTYLRQAAVAAGSVTVALVKNGTTVWTQVVASSTPADVNVTDATFAVGDRCEIVVSDCTSSPTDLAGTFVGTRTA